jgi:hypothetical protein
MLTIEMSKCRYCGATQAPDTSVCSSCGTRLRPSAGKVGGGAKAAPVGLDSAALLHKINSLDWDPTTTMSDPPPTSPQKAVASWRFLAAPVLIGLAILVVGALALLFVGGTPTAPAVKEPVHVEVKAPMVPDAAISLIPPSPAAEAPAPPSPEAAEVERDKVLRTAEEAVQRRADKKRKAQAEQQARDELERQRRADDEHRRLEQEAAEARARAAAAVVPAPKGPASPQELCSGAGGLFARSICEARACAQPEWRQHEFCVKRWQEEMRKFNSTEYR